MTIQKVSHCCRIGNPGPPPNSWGCVPGRQRLTSCIRNSEERATMEQEPDPGVDSEALQGQQRPGPAPQERVELFNCNRKNQQPQRSWTLRQICDNHPVLWVGRLPAIRGSRPSRPGTQLHHSLSPLLGCWQPHWLPPGHEPGAWER